MLQEIASLSPLGRKLAMTCFFTFYDMIVIEELWHFIVNDQSSIVNLMYWNLLNLKISESIDES